MYQLKCNGHRSIPNWNPCVRYPIGTLISDQYSEFCILAVLTNIFKPRNSRKGWCCRLHKMRELHTAVLHTAFYSSLLFLSFFFSLHLKENGWMPCYILSFFMSEQSEAWPHRKFVGSAVGSTYFALGWAGQIYHSNRRWTYCQMIYNGQTNLLSMMENPTKKKESFNLPFFLCCPWQLLRTMPESTTSNLHKLRVVC